MFVPQRYDSGSDYEKYSADLLIKYIHDGSLFVDIGAKYGYYSLLVGSYYPHCQVISIDPHPENCEILKKKIVLNGLKNIKPYHLVVSNKAVPKGIYIDETREKHDFGNHPSATDTDQIEVENLPLCDFFKDADTKEVFIRIDVAGHEVDILEGMRDFLGDNENVRLLIKFVPKHLLVGGYTPEGFLQKISQLGFDLYIIDEGERMIYKLHSHDFSKLVDYLPRGDIANQVNLLCINREKSLNVVFFASSALLWGAQRSLMQLVDELTRDYGVLCSVVLPSLNDILKQHYEEAGTSALIIKYGKWMPSKIPPAEQIYALSRANWMGLSCDIKNTLNKINPDIIVSNSLVIPWGAIAASFLGKPHVWFIRELNFSDEGGFKSLLPLNVVLDLVRRFSDVIVTNSNCVKNALFNNISDEKAKTVYPRVAIPSDALEDNGTNYFTRRTATKLIAVGRDEEAKGWKDAILATKDLIARGKDVALILVGHSFSDYGRQLEAIVEREGLDAYVKFLGFQENPYAIMSEADIILVCTRIEAFGRVAVEGMMLKKPVIGAGSGGTAELIEDGVNGLLYEPGNHIQLATKIEYLIEHGEKARELAENGWRFAEETFTKERYGGAAYKILADLKKAATSTNSHPDFTMSGTDLFEALFAVAGTGNPKATNLIMELTDSLRAKEAELKRLRRRRYYELVQAGISIIRNEGWRTFWVEFRRWCKCQVGL